MGTTGTTLNCTLKVSCFDIIWYTIIGIIRRDKTLEYDCKSWAVKPGLNLKLWVLCGSLMSPVCPKSTCLANLGESCLLKAKIGVFGTCRAQRQESQPPTNCKMQKAGRWHTLLVMLLTLSAYLLQNRIHWYWLPWIYCADVRGTSCSRYAWLSCTVSIFQGQRPSL